MQLAMGRTLAVPGLISEPRTQSVQLSEEEQLRQTLQKCVHAQTTCMKADIDVKLRRALLRQFRGLDPDLSLGKRCLYWRESNNKFHTIRWRGPAVVVAIQRDPGSGQVSCYWLAHGIVLIRASRQHVKRMLDGEGRMASSEEALEALRQRRVVRILDLDKTNKRHIDELDPDKDLERSSHVSRTGSSDVSMRLRRSDTSNSTAEHQD